MNELTRLRRVLETTKTSGMRNGELDCFSPDGQRYYALLREYMSLRRAAGLRHKTSIASHRGRCMACARRASQWSY